METTKTFKDARLIIQNLYNEKILYHNRQLLHIQECMGGNVAEVERKINELEATRIEIIDFLDTPEMNRRVYVSGNIQISLQIG
jgi:hypothetical protein